MNRSAATVTVCQLPDHLDEETWADLSGAAGGSDLVVLPEMPFHRWLAADRTVEPERWLAAVESHRRWEERIDELGAARVLWTRPTQDPSNNEARLWASGDSSPVHRKHYLPDEPDYWEATWYQPAPARFQAHDAGPMTVGVMICTDMWFFQHAREYGRAGVEVLAVPRATPRGTTDKWLAGGRAAAIVSGAWCLSSNRGGGRFGGAGWVIEPEAGEVVGVTTENEPFLTLTIDLDAAHAAKSTYPRYVED